jgi:hypothetical protein
MPRPLNKTQLLNVIQKEYTLLEETLTKLTDPQLAASGQPEAWAAKDFITHLYEWQQMLFTWYHTGRRGETPAVPAPGYKWSQMPALNRSIFEKYRDLAPESVLAMFRQSHRDTVQFIQDLPDADLTTHGLFPWMNQNTLLAYLNSATAAHYLWARKEIIKSLKF